MFEKCREIGLFCVVVALVGGGFLDADEQSESAEGSVKARSVPFVPGPPIWQLPENRPYLKSDSSTLEDAVDQCVQGAMAQVGTPGASVAVIVNGELVYEQGYGVKKRGESDPVDAETRFRIGSVTKMLTAAAVMQQVEAGTAFLDDPVSRHVPEATFTGRWSAETMTVEQLLTHASGIPDLYFEAQGSTDPNALGDWAATLADIGLHAPPGTFWNYSNPNFNLAGLVAERASGADYRSYMDTSVFGPAGMTHTTFDPAEVVASGNWSWGHTPDGDGGELVYAADEYDNFVVAPAGFAFSTAGDLVRWALLLSDGGGSVLSEESARMMQAFHQDLDQVPGFGYGYGIFVEPFFDLTVRQHGGNIWGWGTYLLWHPERRFAVAVLANTFQSLPGAAYCVADVVLEPDHSANPYYPTDYERRRMYQGRYDVTLRAGDTPEPYPLTGEVSMDFAYRLTLHLEDAHGSFSETWRLYHAVLDVFYADVDDDGQGDLDISFLTSDGEPEQVRWLRMRPLVGSLQQVPRGGLRLTP
jgi:CubicO group peptidase (beta-lactamase class C family)